MRHRIARRNHRRNIQEDAEANFRFYGNTAQEEEATTEQVDDYWSQVDRAIDERKERELHEAR
jgi:hypothetical protein